MPRANSFADFIWRSWMPDLEDELVSLLGAMRSAFPIHIEPTVSSGSPVPVSTKFLIDDNIDAIVQRCQEYAAELNSKYEDLNNFKPDVTVQQWEGEDFRPDLQGPIPVNNPIKYSLYIFTPALKEFCGPEAFKKLALRIPTPPPGDDEPCYLTVVHPYILDGHCNMKLPKDRQDFTCWVAIVSGLIFLSLLQSSLPNNGPPTTAPCFHRKGRGWAKGAPKSTRPVGNAWKAAIVTSFPAISGLKKQPTVGGGPIAVKASDVWVDLPVPQVLDGQTPSLDPEGTLPLAELPLLYPEQFRINLPLPLLV
ncbi:hypothetical protein EDB19DRAFT_2003962 [Suillus lakei]|nr:hypothetical protein EDB19DRAFT_2003962 [Suillus lakei]